MSTFVDKKKKEEKEKSAFQWDCEADKWGKKRKTPLSLSHSKLFRLYFNV